MWEIAHYVDQLGVDHYQRWLSGLADRRVKARVMARISRLAQGAFGDCRPIAEGVWELRIDCGPGYRVYYAQAGKELILLLCGGDKRKQDADIKRAMEHWRHYQRGD
jgi:putative addiction module killer protein